MCGLPGSSRPLVKHTGCQAPIVRGAHLKAHGRGGLTGPLTFWQLQVPGSDHRRRGCHRHARQQHALRHTVRAGGQDTQGQKHKGGGRSADGPHTPARLPPTQGSSALQLVARRRKLRNVRLPLAAPALQLRGLKMVLANGSLVEFTPEKNLHLFRAAGAALVGTPGVRSAH